MSDRSAKLLSSLLKKIITDRFKQMARDEKLTRFLASKTDPAQLVELHVSAEREALQMALLRVDKGLAGGELDRSLQEIALQIQIRFQKIYGSDVLPINQASQLLDARTQWLRTRVDFYTRWLGVRVEADSAEDLARAAFRSQKAFQKYLRQISLADEALSKEILKSTNPTFRLMMKHQMELEDEQARSIWDSCAKLWFKETKELSDV